MNQTLTDLPHFLQARYQPGKRAAWVLAVAMHVLLTMCLIYGMRWQTAVPESVSVDLVSYPPTAAQAEKPIVPTPQNVQKEEPPAPPPSPKLAEILRKVPDKPKTIKENAAEKVNAISKLLQRETDRIMNSRIAAAANREQVQIKASQAMATKATARATWAARISAKIRSNIVRPPNVAGNPEAIYEISLLPDGSLFGEPLIKKSTGNALLDDAIVRAILKSSPLPNPDDPATYERVLKLTFRPMED